MWTFLLIQFQKVLFKTITKIKKEQQFLDLEIATLLDHGYIREFNEPVCISPIYCIPKKGGTYRLINDLCTLNGHCRSLRFQYEDIKCVLDIVRPHDQLITLDIKDGFYHIPVSTQSQKYLGFK